MTCKASWVPFLRTVLVTGFLVIALLGAVLGAIGTSEHLWRWAGDPDIPDAGGKASAPDGKALIYGTAAGRH